MLLYLQCHFFTVNDINTTLGRLVYGAAIEIVNHTVAKELGVIGRNLGDAGEIHFTISKNGKSTLLSIYYFGGSEICRLPNFSLSSIRNLRYSPGEYPVCCLIYFPKKEEFGNL